MAKPSKAALGKRKAAPPPANKNAKKAKGEQELGPTGKPKRKPDQPKKVKLRDQKYLPVPATEFEGDDEEFSDEDLGVEEGLEAGFAASFMKGLDKHALSRTIKEQNRLHTLSKNQNPLPKQPKQKLRLPSPGAGSNSDDYDLDSNDELPSDLGSEVDFGNEAEGSGTSTLDDDEVDSTDGEEDDGDQDQSDLNDAFDDMSDESDEEVVHEKRKRRKAEAEEDYETQGRSRWAREESEEEKKDTVEVGRLPIKLPTGEVQAVAGSTTIDVPQPKKKAPKPVVKAEEEDEEQEDLDSEDGKQAERMAGLKGKFGRMGVAEIVGMAGWKNAQRLEAAKEQIAATGAEILAGGELVDIGPVLTRLSTFALPTVPSLEDDQPPLPVPHSIRGLAFLSQLAVYKDLIPGYRIRQLTATEEAEKVRDEVKRMREGEKMLVRSYKGYLKMLEYEVKKRTPLASLSLKCMCDLLTAVTHFNFSENIMGVLVGRLARKSWDEDAELALGAFVDVFKNDISGTHSQTLVRLIARMIKERKFQVHPNVLGCLMHLRLRQELDAMRNGKKGKGRGKEDESKIEKKFKSDLRKKWQTKNQKKREREQKEVEKEMAEAEAEVDQDERAQIHTETLKNLFVLYFSILKFPGRSPLLPASLEGISQFAQMINVDFFRDLLAVLRRIILDQQQEKEEGEEDNPDPVGASVRIRTRLLAIVTAFELLSGQGEAINIDLNDFINALYSLLRPLALDTGIEDPPLVSTKTSVKPAARPLQVGRKPPRTAVQLLSTSDLLFRCLHAIFFARHVTTASAPPWRAAAFAKRLSESALLLPPHTALQAVQFVRALMTKEPKIEAMLDTEERTYDGVYKPEMEDPQLSNPFASSLWELEVLGSGHWDVQVRREAAKLREGKLDA